MNARADARPALATRWALGILAVCVGCAEANEAITLVFPDETSRRPVETIVVTVLDPFVRSTDAEPRFVGCDRIGAFGATDEIPVGPERDSSPHVLRRVRAEFPLAEKLEVGFDAVDARADNPWGVVAVFFEARGSARIPVFGARDPRRGEATLLSGCFCARTRAGRFPERDEALDRSIREACPLVGGRDGRGPSARRVPLESVPPSSFRLEPCGAPRAAAPADGRVWPGPLACVRTERCGDSAREPCFDCSLDCPELEDLAGAPIEMRVATPGAPVRDARQIVLTDSRGRAAPELEVRGCDGAFDVEATVLGRATTPVRFRVDCGVEPAAELAVRQTVPLEGRLVAVAAVPAVRAGGQGAIAVLIERGDPESDDVLAELATFEGSGGRLANPPNGTLAFEGHTGHGVVSHRDSSDPAEPRRVVVATVDRRGEGGDAMARLSVHRFGSEGLARQPELRQPAACDVCDCGSLRPCDREASCAEDEACANGRCRAVSPRFCEASAECAGNGRACILGACAEVASCDEAGGCPPGFACRNGVCDAEWRCEADDDCSNGAVCLDGRCTLAASVSCVTRDDCQTGSMCSAGRCVSIQPCRCALRPAPEQRVVIRARDLDDDGRDDYAVAQSGGRVVTFFFRDAAASECACVRINPPLVDFDLPELGNEALTANAARGFDLAFISEDGLHVRHGETLSGGIDRVTCGSATLVGEVFFVRDLRALRSRCPASRASCAPHEDVLLVGRTLRSGDVLEPIARIVYGGASDVSGDPELFDRPGTHDAYFLSELRRDPTPRPRRLETGDFNGDDVADFVVLSAQARERQPELQLWLGSGAGTFVASSRVAYDRELGPCDDPTELAVVDLEGDGRDEVVVGCEAGADSRLLLFAGER